MVHKTDESYCRIILNIRYRFRLQIYDNYSSSPIIGNLRNVTTNVIDFLVRYITKEKQTHISMINCSFIQEINALN